MTAARGNVVDLDDYRRTAPLAPVPAIDTRAVGGGSACRPGLTHRLTHSPLAEDLRRLRDERDQVLAAGLLLAVLIVLLIGAAS